MAMRLTNFKVKILLFVVLFSFAAKPLFATTSYTLIVANFTKAVSSLPLNLRDNGGVGRMKEYADVLRAGPNTLPSLFQQYEGERDEFVQLAIEMAIKRIALYHKYRYPSHSKNPIYASDLPTTPLLSQAVDENGLFINSRDNQVEMWGRLGEALINRNQSKINWERLAKAFNSGNLVPTNLRLYEAEMTLGIYNLPVILKSIGEHNSAVAFNEFLRLSHSSLYNQVCPLGEWNSCFAEAAKVVPTRAGKVQVVKDWWAQSAKMFTELPRLHSAIASAIEQLNK